MGLYDEYEDKEQHNYLAVKNNGKIIIKNTIMFDGYNYGMDKNDIPSLFLNDIKFNEIILKLKTKNYKLYWAGFLILSFDEDNFYYGFKMSEIKNEIRNEINIYIFDNKESFKEIIKLNLTEL